jgi:hypothetical protein
MIFFHSSRPKKLIKKNRAKVIMCVAGKFSIKMFFLANFKIARNFNLNFFLSSFLCFVPLELHKIYKLYTHTRLGSHSQLSAARVLSHWEFEWLALRQYGGARVAKLKYFFFSAFCHIHTRWWSHETPRDTRRVLYYIFV